jgi:hypothetical protein
MNVALKQSPTWQRIEQEEAQRVFALRKAAVDEFESTKARLLAERPGAEAKAKDAAAELAKARARFEAAEAASITASQRVSSIGARIDSAERRLRKALSGTTPPVLEELLELVYEAVRTMNVTLTPHAKPAETQVAHERIAATRKRLLELRDEIEALRLKASAPDDLVALVGARRREIADLIAGAST